MNELAETGRPLTPEEIATHASGVIADWTAEHRAGGEPVGFVVLAPDVAPGGAALSIADAVRAESRGRIDVVGEVVVHRDQTEISFVPRAPR